VAIHDDCRRTDVSRSMRQGTNRGSSNCEGTIFPSQFLSWRNEETGCKKGLETLSFESLDASDKLERPKLLGEGSILVETVEIEGSVLEDVPRFGSLFVQSGMDMSPGS
jgi:hypothetical protein